MPSSFAIGRIGQPEVVAPSCALRFMDFAGAAIAGNLAAAGTVWLTRKAVVDPKIQHAATVFTGLAAFWLVGGLTWLALARRKA
jgi:hypothetical protein